jgi:hypothetical protein
MSRKPACFAIALACLGLLWQPSFASDEGTRGGGDEVIFEVISTHWELVRDISARCSYLQIDLACMQLVPPFKFIVLQDQEDPS